MAEYVTYKFKTNTNIFPNAFTQSFIPAHTRGGEKNLILATPFLKHI